MQGEAREVIADYLDGARSVPLGKAALATLNHIDDLKNELRRVLIERREHEGET